MREMMFNLFSKVNIFYKLALNNSDKNNSQYWLQTLDMDNWEDLEKAIEEEIINLNIDSIHFNEFNNRDLVDPYKGLNHQFELNGPISKELKNDNILITINLEGQEIQFLINSNVVYEATLGSNFYHRASEEIVKNIKKIFNDEELSSSDQEDEKDEIKKAIFDYIDENSKGSIFEISERKLEVMESIEFINKKIPKISSIINITSNYIFNDLVENISNIPNIEEKDFLFYRLGIKNIPSFLENLQNYINVIYTLTKYIKNYYGELENEAITEVRENGYINLIKENINYLYEYYNKLPKICKNGFSEIISDFLYENGLNIIKKKDFGKQPSLESLLIKKTTITQEEIDFIKENTVNLTNKDSEILSKYGYFLNSLNPDIPDLDNLLSQFLHKLNLKEEDFDKIYNFIANIEILLNNYDNNNVTNDDLISLNNSYNKLPNLVQNGYNIEVKKILEELKNDVKIDDNLIIKMIKQASKKENSNQPRMMFFKNYDYIEDPTGPGEGLFQNMHKYKSVKDFLNKKRKRNKKARKHILSMIKLGIDFVADDYSSPDNYNFFDSEINNYLPSGQTDYANSNYDFEDKNISELNFGRDYTNDSVKINKLLDQLLTPAEAPEYGISDGVVQDDDSFYKKNTYQGILDTDSHVKNKLDSLVKKKL